MISEWGYIVPTAADTVEAGREGDVKDPRVVAFRMPVWRWLVAVGTVTHLAAAALTIVPDVLIGRVTFDEDDWIPYASAAAGGTAALAVGMPAYVLVWRVWVGPDTLRGSDFWGRFVTVTWGSIRDVRPLHVPLLPVLRVYSTETRRVIWLPLFLVDFERFAGLVAGYAGEDHPVARAAWQRIEGDS